MLFAHSKIIWRLKKHHFFRWSGVTKKSSQKRRDFKYGVLRAPPPHQAIFFRVDTFFLDELTPTYSDWCPVVPHWGGYNSLFCHIYIYIHIWELAKLGGPPPAGPVVFDSIFWSHHFIEKSGVFLNARRFCHAKITLLSDEMTCTFLSDEMAWKFF